MNIIKYIRNYVGTGILCTAIAALTLHSCKEDIDDSNLYTFTGEMMTDHFANNPDLFSSYLTILGKVHPSKRSSSTMQELLSARGHYTCFAPTNDAISEYLDSLYEIQVIPSPKLEDITDSVAEAIVFNSIIENGDAEAFATTDFATGTSGALQTTNMNDRYIKITYGTEIAKATETDTARNTVIYVNLNSKIIDADIEVENGYIHTIDKVLSPSSSSVAELVQATENTQFFGELLNLTGWDVKMTDYKDESWEENDLAGTTFKGKSGSWQGQYPEKRYIGYTIFVETDEVYEREGITDIPSLKEWVKEHAYYDDDANMTLGITTQWDDEDYTDPGNWLNQFVAYHCLPEKLTFSNMVTYANEYGFYAGQTHTASNSNTPVWEYWETLGPQRRSIKITGCKVSGQLQKRINRKSVNNNSRTGNYRERIAEITIPGININENNISDNEGLNGFYYTIDDILIWSEEIPGQVLNERLRYDITSLFPELLTNNIKQNKSDSWYFTADYLDNVMEITDATEFEYLPNTSNSSGSGSWVDYQTDEFNIRGIYDFTMKLPPVPYTGTYEIRYGVWANNNRGMAQIYMGKDWQNLPAIGIPIDLRSSGVGTTSTGWVDPSTLTNDEDYNENTKTMRNMGFMRGSRYIQYNGGTAYENVNNVRKIIWTGQLEAGETYYIRFKTVLDNDQTEFFYDYLEFVPKTVYAGDEPEDVW